MYKLPIICLILSSCFNAFSQSKKDSIYKNESGFRSEYDSYLAFGQDRYYTNGLFLTFRHAADQSKLKDKTAKKIWEVEAGHSMYNPYTGKITNPATIDRPFAAYLYASGRINWHFKSEKLLATTLQAGTIGPAAKGKEAQELLHDIIGFYEVGGWEYQLENEFGVNAVGEFMSLLGRSASKKTDISFDGTVNLGNTFAGLGAGLLFRTGRINPLYRSVSTNSRISNNSILDSVPAKELLFFAKPSLHYTAYDATIQGGMFRDDKGPFVFDPKRFVFTQELGIMYAQRRWTLNFSIVFKSREIKSPAKAHQYGSAAVYYRFN